MAAETRTKQRKTRPAAAGDIPPEITAPGIERFTINETTQAARDSKSTAVRDIIDRMAGEDKTRVAESLRAILDGASPDDAAALLQALDHMQEADQRNAIRHADDQLADNWREGGYPYQNLLSRRNYEKQKYHLQVELLKLQAWVKETGQRVVILFEGRDAAGKGGTIKRFMEHLNPRGARVVALEKPSGTVGVLQLGKAALDLGHSLTPMPKPTDQSTLKTNGIYRFVRHPIYGGLMMLCGGFDMALPSIGAMLPAICLIPLLIYKARSEEVWLRDRYPEYNDYAQRTRKFLIGIW